MKAMLAACVMALAGCGAPSVGFQRSHEIDAALPRAIGLGAFAPTCLFICIVTATFDRGGDETVNADEDAHMHDSMRSELKGKAR